jgi:hypothetical protein
MSSNCRSIGMRNHYKSRKRVEVEDSFDILACYLGIKRWAGDSTADRKKFDCENAYVKILRCKRTKKLQVRP